MSDLSGLIIAFDIDGTLYDPGGSAYRSTTGEILKALNLGLDELSAWNAYESLRRMGRGIERLGLRNPNHFRTHAETLAVLYVLFADASRLRTISRISPLVRDVMRESLQRLDESLPDRGETDWRLRLVRQRHVRALLRSDVSLSLLRDEVRRIASQPVVADWVSRCEAIEKEAKLHDPTALLELLENRGANLVVISEGLVEVQQAKLARLGIEHFFSGRVLITQAAGAVPGIEALDHALEPFLDSDADSVNEAGHGDLTMLWQARCIVSLWSTKSPWFYGRCLHALRADATNPAAALKRLAMVPREVWTDQPLRFVMIGDRYDRDIAPIQSVVGTSQCLTVRLADGRYAQEFDSTSLPPPRRPSQTFSSWQALAEFLANQLSKNTIPPLSVTPSIGDKKVLNEFSWDSARKSPYRTVQEVVRAVDRCDSPQ